MKIAYFDVYNPLPVNSGGDWYRIQLLNEIGRENDVTEYFTYDYQKKGMMPKTILFSTSYIPSILPWYKLSKIMEIFKPEVLFYPNQIKKIQADIVFVSTVCYHVAKIVSMNCGVPLILVMQNIEWQYLRGNRSLLYVPMRPYEHYIMKNVDAIIALSPPDYNYVRTHFPEKKVFYIPPKIETEIFNNYGERHDFGSDKYNLLFYGSLDRPQNIEGLHYIIKTLIPSLKESGLMSKIRINIFGSGNPPKDLDLHNNSDINYVGQVENPGEYVRGADLVIVPVRNSGGMKIRLLESLACGKCVIATPEAIAGLPDELTKFIPTAKTKEEFVQIINKFLHGEIAQSMDSSTIHTYLKGESIDEVLAYTKSIV